MADALGSPPPPPPRVDGFKGINNRGRPVALGLEWQLDAADVLADGNGWLRSRPGAAPVAAGIVDAFATLDGRLLLVDAQARLIDAAPDGAGPVLAEGFIGGPFSWFELGTAALAISPRGAWAVYPDRVVPWGIPACPPPAATLADSPGAPAGRRLVACAWVASDGRVGGAAAVAALDVRAGQVAVLRAPALTDHRARLYASPPDGEVLYALADVAGGAEVALGAGVDLAHPLDTARCYPPPPGHVAAAWRGRAVVAEHEPALDRSALYFSRAGQPHLFEIETDFQMVAGRVMALREIPAGLVIATDRDVFLMAPDWSRQALLPVGSPASDMPLTPDGAAWLWSGLGPFLPATREAPSAKFFDPPPASACAAGVWPHDGDIFLVAALSGSRARQRPVQPRETPVISDVRERGIEG